MENHPPAGPDTPIPASPTQKPPSSQATENLVTAARGGGVTFVAKLITSFISFGLSIVIARYLGAEQLGLFRLSLTITGFATALSYLGLHGVVRYLPIARQKQSQTKIWGIIQTGIGIPGLIGLTITAVLFVFSRPLAYYTFNDPDLLPVLRVSLLAVPLAVFAKSLSAIAQGFKKVEYIAYSQEVVYTLVRLVLTLALLMLGWGVMGVTWAYLLSFLLSTFLLFRFVYQLYPLLRPLNPANRLVGRIIKFSFPLYLSRLLGGVGNKFETLVLGFFGVMADVGVFSAALRLSDVGNMFFSSLRTISMPIISELHSQGNFKELNRFYQITAKWSFTFNFPIFLTILLFADALLAVFGEGFAVGKTALIILAVGVMFNSGTGLSDILISMSGYSKIAFINAIFYLVVTIIFDLLLIPKWQLLGAAWAGMLSIVVVNTARMVQVYVLLEHAFPFNRSFWKPIAAGLIATALTYPLSQTILLDLPILRLVLVAPVLWVIYGICIFAFKLSKEDRMILDKVLGRLGLARFFRLKSGA